jgi:hypothetical protein
MARWCTLRDQGTTLPADEHAELEALIAAELQASAARAVALADALGRCTRTISRWRSGLDIGVRIAMHQKPCSTSAWRWNISCLVRVAVRRPPRTGHWPAAPILSQLLWFCQVWRLDYGMARARLPLVIWGHCAYHVCHRRPYPSPGLRFPCSHCGRPG